MRIFYLRCILFTIISTNLFTTIKAQVNRIDSLTLVDLYNSTNGPDWNIAMNWLTEKPVSTWYGITLTGTRVTYIRLVANSLQHQIPATISNLTALESLDLGTNHLSGSIPSSIGNLSHILYLYLNNNELSDSIPSSLGNLPNLLSLQLYSNYLTGSIPSALGNLKNLGILYLGYNRLGGSIPASIGNLIHLYYLQLYDNQLSGTIPSSIGNLINLRTLELENNQLSGEIPFSISNLKKLNYFNFSSNQLTQYTNADYSTNNPTYVTGDLRDNRFTFDGLEFVSQKFRNVPCDYQASIPIHRHYNTLSIYAGGTLKNNTYYWSRIDAKGYTTIKGDSTFTPQQDGKYYVYVTNAVVIGGFLLSDTVNFVSNNSTIENYFAYTANIAAIKKQHFQAFPNPASQIVHIQVNGAATINVINSTGKMMLTKTINNTGYINVRSFANGIYHLHNETTGESQKLIIVH